MTAIVTVNVLTVLVFDFGDQRVTVNMATWVTLEQEVMHRFQAGEGFTLATINLDHLVNLAASPDYCHVYGRQELIVADGRQIVVLSRLARQPVELIPGSDLIVPQVR